MFDWMGSPNVAAPLFSNVRFAAPTPDLTNLPSIAIMTRPQGVRLLACPGRKSLASSRLDHYSAFVI
jgi:hypothetical protein